MAGGAGDRVLFGDVLALPCIHGFPAQLRYSAVCHVHINSSYAVLKYVPCIVCLRRLDAARDFFLAWRV